MNILLITVDTLRYDYVGYANNYLGSRTPNLDQISRRGLAYKFAFSTGTSTPFAFPGILASVYSHQYLGGPGISKVRFSFPEYLKSKGFVTCGLNGGNLYLSSLYGYGSRFDYFSKDVISNHSSEEQSSSLNAKKKVLGERLGVAKLLQRNKVNNWIKNLLNSKPFIETADSQVNTFRAFLSANISKRFFCAMNLMEFHGPYVGLFDSNLFERLRMQLIFRKKYCIHDWKYLRWIRKYQTSAVEIVDDAIGKLINMLDIKGLLNDTLVIITSDHGDEYLEHGDCDHKPKPYDELIRVPLIIFSKSLSVGPDESEKDELVSLIDLAPSIAKFLFNEKPKHFMGEATLLGGSARRDYVLSEGFQRLNDPHRRHDPKREGIRNWAVRTKTWKFLSMGNEKCSFDMTLDPREVHKLTSESIEGEAKDFIAEINKRELSSTINARMRQRH